MTVDHADFQARAELLNLQMARVSEKARAAHRGGQYDKLAGYEAESILLLESMRNLREEQVMAQLEERRRNAQKRRRWWRFWA